LADGQGQQSKKSKKKHSHFESRANAKRLREVPEQNKFQTENRYKPNKSNLSKSANNSNAK